MDANDPILMKARGNGKQAPEFGQETGNAGLDGYTVLARRSPTREPSEDDPYPMFGYGSRSINPSVGMRDFRRGPRFSED